MIKLLAVLSLALTLPGQMPLLPATSLQGVVTNAATGEPLSDAVVTLSSTGTRSAASEPAASLAAFSSSVSAGVPLVALGSSANQPGPPGTASTTTGADGKFSFASVDPGQYRIEVLRNGFARQVYGQRFPGAAAAAVAVAAGQPVPAIAIALVPAGNLSGVVRGAQGTAQAGVPLHLLRTKYNSGGQRTFEIVSTARTDDRGEYRMYWVSPGRYFLAAGSPPGPNRPLTPTAAAATPNEVPQSYAFAYYPGVADPRAAGVVDIAPGSDLRGIDLVVAPQKLARIRGRLLSAESGRPPAAAALSLAYTTLAGTGAAFNSGSTYDPATGTFEMRNIPPGSYILQAAADDPAAGPGSALRIEPVSTRPNARLAVQVSDDISGLVLSLSSGFTVRGRITLEGNPISSIPGWNRLSVRLTPAVHTALAPNLQPPAPLSQAPAADGTFVIGGVFPGEFQAGTVTGLPRGFYVKDVKFGQTSVLGRRFQISGPGAGPYDIVLGYGDGQVEGVAVDGAGAPAAGVFVVLVPDQAGRADLFRAATTGAGGRFAFGAVPPGIYRVFAWEGLESYAYFDPDLLRQVERYGALVQTAQPGSGSVTVRTIPLNP